ncbi:MAG: DUF763 domain-containing protein [Bacillota bacterium]|nr:DUF763 domain-containing protein [Bacillota bacterium]
MRTGMASLPLHRGHCPPWLFQHMKRLGAAILQVIAEEFGPEEILRRLADPVWFQALGCVLGFDWHSSGLTTTVCGALKEGLAERSQDVGVFLAGGKGRSSRRTPEEIARAAERHGLGVDVPALQYASRMAAKVDTAALQDGYDLYHHFFAFTASGAWAVVQQGMNEETRWARRYHWLGEKEKNFVCEPHSGVCGPRAGAVLNMVAAESERARAASVALVKEKPEAVLRELRRIEKGALTQPEALAVRQGGGGAPLLSESGQLSLPGMGLRSLSLPAGHAVPDADRLNRVLQRLYEEPPRDFAGLLAAPGVGPATVRALALVAEVAYGAPPSFRDPVRYSFAHGGKDGHPFPVNRADYAHSWQVLEDALRRARLGNREKLVALRRLAAWVKGERQPPRP